jgi:WD40 repeat protein
MGREAVVRVWDWETADERAATRLQNEQEQKEKKKKKKGGEEPPRPGGWREVAALDGPSDWCEAIALSPSGDMCLGGSRDGALHLWVGPKAGGGAWSRPGCVAKAHPAGADWGTGDIKSCCFDATPGPPEWCATGGSDARVKIWDLSSLGSGAEPAVQERAGHSGSVQVLAASPVCALLASGGADGKLLAWDARGGGQPGAIAFVDIAPQAGAAIVSLAFEPSGVGTAGTWVLTADSSGCVKVFDVRTWGLLRTLDQPRARTGADSEGDFLGTHYLGVAASPSGWACALTADGTVVSWDPSQDWAERARVPRQDVKASALAVVAQVQE